MIFWEIWKHQNHQENINIIHQNVSTYQLHIFDSCSSSELRDSTGKARGLVVAGGTDLWFYGDLTPSGNHIFFLVIPHI
jgi:hypothetical protein